jgi:putative ABC transport system ATP-binding protein
MLLSIRGVTRTYHRSQAEVRALDGVSLEVSAGEFVAVEGPSGCGKTTLLLVAGGLLRPDTGEVLLDGQNPYALPADKRAAFRARQIGFVFQEFHLVPYLSVLHNVLAPTLATAADGARDRAFELIERFGLGARMHHVPAELSSGERQRTALARALLNRPQLLLADEPTGNLDRENAEAVLRTLREFADEGGAVLLVTHDEHAAGCAHRRVRLSAGRVTSETRSVGVQP